MRSVVALLVSTLLTSSLSASETARYLAATRQPARTAQLRMLRDPDDVRAHAVREFAWVKAFAADLTADEVAELKRSPEIRYVTPVVARHASVEDSGPPLSGQPGAAVLHSNGSVYASSQTVPYGVTMIHAPELWPLTKGGGPINVAILDTGIDTKHADLAGNLAGGYNTFTKTNDPTDDNGHGTHVAGIIAALDNGIGVVGVAPQARIWSVKVLDNTGFGADENVIAGVDWVISKKHELGGDWIMSLSLGASQSSAVEEEAFKRVIAEGIIAVAAAGNRSFPDVEFPAAYEGVIAVGAVDSTSTLAIFSDHGPHLSVVAPGVRVLSTAPTGTVPAAGVTLPSGSNMAAAALKGSRRGEIVSTYVFCGLGNPADFSAEVKGKIALIQRGELTFNEKVRNAEAAGVAGVVIFNNQDSDFSLWTLLRPDCEPTAGCDDPTHPWPVVLGVSTVDGQRLLNDAVRIIDMGSWMDDYTIKSGTSMAAPHVSGAIALIWSLAPDAGADRVRDALLSAAVDLGTPGFDEMYGFGLVNAVDAAMRLAPWRFEIGAPPPRPRRQRPSDHR